LNNVSASNVQPAELRLVDAAVAGDREAWRELFERYRTPAFHVAYRITGRSEDALDVVQDSFIKAFQSLGSFQRDAGFKTWLLRIVVNRALDLLRARRVRLAVSFDGDQESGTAPEPAATGEPDPGRRLEQQEIAQRLAAAVEELPPDQRAVFSLYAGGDMTYGQIAEVLGVPVGTVMSRLYHARLKLKARLADLDPGRSTETGRGSGEARALPSA
jgi:RNA polymerase sigma-70 factor (ECF subfamily)